MRAHQKVIVEVGERYGYLTVDSFVGYDGKGKPLFMCLCKCGNTKVVDKYGLASGRVKSCNCKKKEHNRLHGHAGEPEYKAWVSMKRRCADNPKSKYYKNYFLKGITVCSDWQEYEKFLVDLGPIPAKGYTLERIDGTRGYRKENCKWATTEEQNRNRSTNRYFLIDGVRRICFAELTRFLGVEHYMVRNRLIRGMTVLEAIQDLGVSDKYSSLEELHKEQVHASSPRVRRN